MAGGGVRDGERTRQVVVHPAQEAASNPAKDSLVPPTQVPITLHVLVVDDDPDATELLTLGLEPLGYQVHCAGSCAEARDILSAHAVDALVADISLPDGSGRDLARFCSEGAHAPVCIALSGFGRDVDIQESLAAGFDVHLVKPVSIRDLVAVLQRLIHARPVP